jgi:hypothetical protein
MAFGLPKQAHALYFAGHGCERRHSDWKALGHLHYLLKPTIKTKEIALQER